MKWISSLLVFSTLTTTSMASANVRTDGSLLTRSTVDRLLAQGQLNLKQIWEVSPETFVHLQRRAQARDAGKVALLISGGAAVIGCTIALCLMLSRDHFRAEHPAHDESIDIAPPGGSW